MSATVSPQTRQGFPGPFKRTTTRYALVIDVNLDATDACQEIHRVLARHGFSWQQGSVYFGNENVTAVTCVLATQDLVASLAWFAASVRDIRMLRIEEMNDLMPVVQQAESQ
jgi:virulence-associated protein VapD